MDYTELLMEVRDRSGVPGVVDRGARYVRDAERMMERELKVGAQTTTVTLATDENGNATLPPDYGQVIANRATIDGNTLRTGVADGFVELTYFAKLPPIEVNGTNWLLESDPEIYINAVLYFVYVSKSDERAVGARAILTDLIARLRKSDFMARYSAIDNFTGVQTL